MLPEGFAMLNALIEDFRGLGEEIVTSIDSRISSLKSHLKAQEIHEISEGHFQDDFNKIIGNSDAVLLIAPESDETLYSLTKQVEKLGPLLLSSSSHAIKLTTDKTETHKRALEAHVLVPSAIKVSFSEKPEIIDRICRQIGYPVVFKPIDGVGGAGICIIATQQEIADGLITVQQETKVDTFQIQKLINGLDVSVSAIVSSQAATPISLNAQLIRLAPPKGQSEYQGGYLPLNHQLKDETFENSIKILNHIQGFKGYVGLDFVFSYAPFLIEINPRITTSYLGLREVLSPNPARLILDAALEKPLKKISSRGAVIYSKYSFENSSISMNIPNSLQSHIKILTPPTYLAETSTLFIIAKGRTIKEAQKHLTQFTQLLKTKKNY
ncbi:MAG: ATP-grasp domain-containing protein [Candidatus Helarchaeota archaeon]